jgi:hypothetical protein
MTNIARIGTPFSVDWTIGTFFPILCFNFANSPITLRAVLIQMRRSRDRMVDDPQTIVSVRTVDPSLVAPLPIAIVVHLSSQD